MHEFLAMQGIPLIAVVHDELVLVDVDEGLPDRGETVVGEGFAAESDMRDEVPGVAKMGCQYYILETFGDKRTPCLYFRKHLSASETDRQG